MPALLTFNECGIYCPQADVYIDPWRRVEKAIITHGHSDHARAGHKEYLCHPVTRPILQARLGGDLSITTMDHGGVTTINGVNFSFHPAGHIPGSVQVRVEHKGEVWVATGDHKRHADGISTPWETVPCHTFITECTFGLPIYRWPDPQKVFEQINDWWRNNAANGICSIISAYSLGKAQRVLMGLDLSIGPVLVHGAVANMNRVLSEAGVPLPATEQVTKETPKDRYRTAMVITPGSAIGTPWTSKMRPYSAAMASGWMQLRGWRRRTALDRGFVLSDHADWDALLLAVKETGAERIIATHGYTDIFSDHLKTLGYDACAESTEFAGEGGLEEVPLVEQNEKQTDPSPENG
jgi:putative mRNA 3-end processing factor